MSVPKGHTAVRAQKRARLSDGRPWQDYELFPTPPWATRALFENVFPRLKLARPESVWEPCAGLGHMSETIRDYAEQTLATDIHDYGGDPEIAIGDFHDLAAGDIDFDWIITNPPFGAAAGMFRRATEIARVGVAFLLRLQWLETVDRYGLLTALRPVCCVFTERVPMCEGGYDPKLSTATAYAWFVWRRGVDGNLADFDLRWPASDLKLVLIPPGRRKALFRDSDLKLAARAVPGFVPPSTLKKVGAAQLRLEDA